MGGVCYAGAMSVVRDRLELIDEAEANRRYGLATLLESGGNYGLHVVIIRGDIVEDDLFGDDSFFYGLGFDDVGTVVIDGDVRAREVNISDRLMCLVVRGSLVAERLLVHETELYVVGDLQVGWLRDVDDLITVKGSSAIAVQVGYSDKVIARNGIPVDDEP
jgi:hypothetical protein